METRTRSSPVSLSATVIYSTFMIIGLGLLILSLILILKLYEINPTNPQDEIIIFRPLRGEKRLIKRRGIFGVIKWFRQGHCF